MAQGGPYFKCYSCNRVFHERNQDRHMGHHFTDYYPNLFRQAWIDLWSRV